MKRKKEVQNGASRQVKEAKTNTTLYSINHCKKWKFFQNSSNFFGLW